MDQNQVAQLSSAIVGMMGFFMLFGLAIVAFAVFLFWRILNKAGLSGPLALLVLFPGFGWIIVVCILAFSQWRVVPAPPTYGGLQPFPLPPANYPPPPTHFNPPPPQA
ncbi:MAG: hypothetical protein ACP5E5_00120 [Acidobacteriaceae bacterium]